MTHDELMKGLKALLAVVELHKPVEFSYIESDKETIFIACDTCYINKLKETHIYPCETIQAIEKELK